jgi:DNA-binding transcriptional LysR family regulator
MPDIEYLNDWDDLRIFLAAAQVGSFTEAARVLGTVHTTVGRRVDKLEHRLGSKLFLRHRSGVRLTSSGMALAEHALRIREMTDQIARRLFGEDRSMAGTVRLTITDGLAAYWLVPQLRGFHDAHPSLRLEIAATGSFIDLASGKADIAIRYERPADVNIVCRKLGQVPFALYGSATYLKRYGAPRTVDDISRHKIVENTNLQLNAAFAEWYSLLRQHPSVLSANSSATVLSAVRSGLGLALMPRQFKRVSPDLVQLDVPIRPVSDVWLLCHRDMTKIARIRATLDFIAKQFKMDKRHFAG